jgi:hypothetical protein
MNNNNNQGMYNEWCLLNNCELMMIFTIISVRDKM